MAKIDKPTAKDAASMILEIEIKQVMPIKAANMLPPKTDHGCANGLEGTANNNTADAPIGAIKNGIVLAFPSTRYVKMLVINIPMHAPIEARNRSV
jgi:hypothetical protein